MRAISVAALLALQCVAGVRLGSGGGPLARLRDDLDRHPLAAVQWGKRRTLPKRPNPNDQRRLAAPPPTNTTALHIIDAIGRHWLIYERLTNLVLRSAGRVFSKIKSCIGIFADKSVSGSGPEASGEQFGKQFAAAVGTAAYAYVVGFALVKIIGKFMQILPPQHALELGLDASIHGERAYKDTSNNGPALSKV